MEINIKDTLEEMSFENRYKLFSIEKRAEYIDKLYEPYKVRGIQEDVLKNSPKYQYSDDRKEGYILLQGVDKIGYYAIFLPTENEYEKIKTFAEIKDKIVKLSEMASLQRQLISRNKTLSELNSIERKIDELCNEVFNGKTIDVTDLFLNQSNEKEVETEKETKRYLDYHWFYVGLNFAEGTIQELYNKLETGADIARHLGNIQYRPYITETKANFKKTDKNIYKSYKKMKMIMDYCIENKIEVCDEFNSIYNSIKPH